MTSRPREARTFAKFGCASACDYRCRASSHPHAHAHAHAHARGARRARARVETDDEGLARALRAESRAARARALQARDALEAAGWAWRKRARDARLARCGRAPGVRERSSVRRWRRGGRTGVYDGDGNVGERNAERRAGRLRDGE